MLKRLAFLIALLASSQAFAQSTIPNLTAGGAVGATNLLPIDQGGAAMVSVPVSAVNTFLASSTQTFTNKTIVCANNTLCTIRIANDVSGLGTGVATALAVNTGSVGAFVVNGGVLGTPSSGSLSNATGLPISTGVSGLGTNVAAALGTAVGSAGAFAKNNGDALSGTYSGTPTFSGNLTFSGVPIFSGLSAGTQVSCIGLTAANALALSIGGCGTGAGGGTGFGVDGGTNTQTVTGTTTINSDARWVTQTAISAAATYTLPTVAAFGVGNCSFFMDASGSMSTTNTVTFTANAADSINNGAGGGSTPPYYASNSTVLLCATANNKWTIAGGAQIPNLVSAHLYVGNAGNLPADVAMSGDCTLANTGAVSCFNIAHSVTALQTFTNSDFKLLGSSTGGTTLTSDNAGATNYTLHLPAADTTLAALGVPQSFTAAQRGTPVVISISTSTFTPNFDTGQNFSITLVNASCPCTIANPSTTLVKGQSGMIEIHQSSTGSDTVSWGTDYLYAGGTGTIVLSTAANAVDYIPYYVNNAATGIVLGSIIKAPSH